MSFWDWITGRDAQDVRDSLARIEAGQARIEAKLSTVISKEVEVSGELQNLTDTVHATEGAVQSAVALIEGLHQRLLDAIAAGEPAAIQALADELAASKDSLAAAVAANPLPA